MVMSILVFLFMFLFSFDFVIHMYVYMCVIICMHVSTCHCLLFGQLFPLTTILVKFSLLRHFRYGYAFFHSALHVCGTTP